MLSSLNCRFPDWPHPALLLLRADGDGQERVASSIPQNFTQQSPGDQTGDSSIKRICDFISILLYVGVLETSLKMLPHDALADLSSNSRTLTLRIDSTVILHIVDIFRFISSSHCRMTSDIMDIKNLSFPQVIVNCIISVCL